MNRKGRSLARMLLVVVMLGQSVLLSGCAIPPIITQLLGMLGGAPGQTTQPGQPAAPGQIPGLPAPVNPQQQPQPANGLQTPGQPAQQRPPVVFFPQGVR